MRTGPKVDGKPTFRLGDIIRAEFAHSMLGADGRMFNAIGGKAPGTFSGQKFATGWKEYREGGQRMRIKADVRWDDQCGNGHNSFAITGTTERHESGAWCNDRGGCIHDEIAKRFPGLAPLVKWHLSTSDSPMHYEANVIYLAGDRGYNGLRKGESRQLRNGKTGQLCWKLEDCSAPRYVDGPACPAPLPPRRYVPWMREGEGKERELDAAREAAVWPEATDAELLQEPEQLRAALRARLPALLVEMRAAIEGAGFMWECPA